MNKRIIRKLKPLIYPILFFFCWTNLGIYNLVYAATKDRIQDSAVSDNKKDKTTEEKLEETLERIKKKAEKAEEKSRKGEDSDEEERGIENDEIEVDQLDVEIKKKFKETEDKIKDLPEEIKQRHRDFVREYEENLRELKKDLDDIEKAKTKEEKELSHKKLKEFLEKKKAPEKHTPLDPNKLPHRTPEKKEREPRLKKEEFTEFHKPIQLAFNGDPTTLMLAQATTDFPTPADLSETIEVQFTQEITDLAAQLNNNPVQIYEWVRNNIEFVPTYGSIQGAQMCLWTKECNAFDTASLLIAFLRASNIPARYVYGTIELPIDKVMNWVGGFTDANAALQFIANGGIPVTAVTSGGVLTKARIEHTWVETYTAYGPYSGRSSNLNPKKTWLPLDPSFKQYTYTDGIDLQTEVPFDAQGLVDQLKATGTVNEAEGYVANLDSNLIMSAFSNYKDQLLTYSQTIPDATVGDFFGKKEIIAQNFGILPVTLPYKVVVTGNKNSSIPAILQHKVTFTLLNDLSLVPSFTYTANLPEIANKRTTLSYAPATAADEAVINSYLPKPHPDGSPVQPDEFPTSLPAYLINLKPELKIEGATVAVGSSVGMGADTTFNMQFSAPGNAGNEIITNPIVAGEYLAIIVNSGKIPLSQIESQKSKLSSIMSRLESGTLDNLTKDDLVGELLYTAIFSYFVEIDTNEYIASRKMGVANFRLPSEGILSQDLDVSYFFGIPRVVSFAGLGMDVDRILKVVTAKDGSKDKARQFMILTGMRASALEHEVPEKLYSSIDNPVVGISAVKALQIANDQGIRIYTINQSNIATILPQLQLNSSTTTDIQNAINAGKEVTVSQREISFNGWVGTGYIVMDAETGAAAYMIGGRSGAYIMTMGLLWGGLFMLSFAVSLALISAPLIAAVITIALATVGVLLSNLVKNTFGINEDLSL